MISAYSLPSMPLAAPFEEFLADIAALGVEPVAAGGMDYGIMQARSNARWWLLPVAQGRASTASLAMYQPISASARMARRWIRTALRLGVTSGWASGRIRLARLPALPPAGLPSQFTCAYFTGTDGPHRKTAIQLMDTGGIIIGYAKVSRRAHVRPFLLHEARMLGRMAALRLASAEIPRLLSYEDRGGEEPTILVTDSRKTAGVSSPMEPAQAHLRFLGEMAQRTGSRGAYLAARELYELANDARLPHEWTRRFSLGLQTVSPEVEAMPVALAHGDFTPWNSFVLGERIYVFDWEYAAEERPLGYDLVHYLVAARGIADPAASRDMVLAVVAEALFGGDRETAQAAVLMSLLLHAGFYLRREIESGARAEDWIGGPARGRLIDTMLEAGM